jgi:hypothetical protein
MMFRQSLMVLLASTVLVHPSAWAVPLCIEGTASANSAVIGSCPAGDGLTLAGKGATITIRVGSVENPIPNIPASQIWLVGGHPDGTRLSICGGTEGTQADGPTDENGITTFSGALAVGGCDDDLSIRVLSYILGEPTPNCDIIQVPVEVRSVDLNKDGTVNVADFSAFGALYQNGQYDSCVDFNGDGQENIADFAFYATHNGHSCE